VSVVAQPASLAVPEALAPLAHVPRAWRSLQAREVWTALAIGAGISLVSLLTSLELVLGEDRPSLAALLLTSAVLPMLYVLIALLCWAPVDRGRAEGARRWLHIGLALAITALLCAWVVRPVVFELPAVQRDWAREQARNKGMAAKKPPSNAFMQLRETLAVLVFGGLGFVLLEVRRRRRVDNQALAAILSERATVSRRVFESRLAAMQAQVEPQFLFNTLVDIEALYERDAQRADRILDDLIAYLRVALPRLRETGASAGSLLAEEIDLVRAYLDVVAARHAGRPQVRFVIDAECGGASFYPMLLLPLVQRGVRGAAQDEPPPADRVEITAKRAHDDVFIVLRVHAPGLCEEHPELARVRERLDGLYGSRAALYCSEPKRGITEFTLKIPYQVSEFRDDARDEVRDDARDDLRNDFRDQLRGEFR
jgi:hypothetical protein